jgi:DNA primase
MNVVDDIKHKLDIVDVISQYVKLQKSGRSFKANCPFHTEKTPSFFVFPERQSWHCFGACGTGGDIFTFVMKKEGMDFSQALRLLADKANVPLIQYTQQISAEEKEKQDRLYAINSAAAGYFHSLLLHEKEAEESRRYIAKRGLSSAVVENFQIGFSSLKWDDLIQFLTGSGHREDDVIAAGLVVVRETGGYYDRFRNRLMFPIRDIKGRTIGFGGRALDDTPPKYLNSPQTITFDKSSVIYAIDRAQSAIRLKDSVVITEGYMDTITAHQFGFENTVASMGTALTERQIATLRKLTRNIIVALDADAAGLEATVRSIATIDDQIPQDHWMPWMEDKTFEELVKFEIQVVEISGGKDPDEIIRKSPDQWAKLLETSRPIIDFTLKKEVDNINPANLKDKSTLVSKFLPILSQISDPIRRSHYVQKLARLLQINERMLFDELFKAQSLERRLKSNKVAKVSGIRPDLAISSRHLEEYSLGLLLSYPDLKALGVKIPYHYFEHSENRDILLKWQENPEINTISDKLDPAIRDYYNSLLSLEKQFPPSLQKSKKERESALGDCINRLQERYIKSLELKKKIVLQEEALEGNSGKQLETLIQQGIDESQQLKEIFRKRRRFFSRPRGV